MILYQCDICGEKDLAENADFVHMGDIILCKDCYKKITVDSTLDDVLEIVDKHIVSWSGRRHGNPTVMTALADFRRDIERIKEGKNEQTRYYQRL